MKNLYQFTTLSLDGAVESLARLLRAKILLEKPGKKRGDDAHSFNAFFKLPSLWTVLKNGALVE